MDHASSFISHLQHLLRPLGALYGFAVRLRNRRYDRNPRLIRRADLPVISVGNVTVGGTGKTPVVMEIVRQLSAWGHRPAILTRGYGAAAGETADEVREYAEQLPGVPVIVNPDRAAGAEIAQTSFAADCLVLDDGFQHRRLARDLDVVVIDALDPWGGDRMLPAGRLRESLRSLSRADMFIVTRANQVEHSIAAEIERRLADLNRKAPCVQADVEPQEVHIHPEGRVAIEELAYHDVLPVCGIGNPRTFLNTVAPLAGRVCGRLLFSDHCRYKPRHVERILSVARRLGADWVVTTRKDWVKLAPLWPSASSEEDVRLVRLDARSVLRDDDGVFEQVLHRVLERYA